MAPTFAPQMILPPNKRIVIVTSRFNSFITEKLLTGACGKLMEFGLSEKNLSVYWVPGALEIPIIFKKIIKKQKPHLGIAIGAVVRGETDHYNFVAGESAKGIAQVALDTEVPILNAILTCDNMEQAIDRAGAKSGNKGAEVALAAVEMLSVIEKIK